MTLCVWLKNEIVWRSFYSGETLMKTAQAGAFQMPYKCLTEHKATI